MLQSQIFCSIKEFETKFYGYFLFLFLRFSFRKKKKKDWFNENESTFTVFALITKE